MSGKLWWKVLLLLPCQQISCWNLNISLSVAIYKCMKVDNSWHTTQWVLLVCVRAEFYLYVMDLHHNFATCKYGESKSFKNCLLLQWTLVDRKPMKRPGFPMIFSWSIVNPRCMRERGNYSSLSVCVCPGPSDFILGLYDKLSWS